MWVVCGWCVCVCVCVCVWTRRILEYDPDYSKHELKHRQYLERFLPLFQTLNLDPKPKTQNPNREREIDMRAQMQTVLGLGFRV